MTRTQLVWIVVLALPGAASAHGLGIEAKLSGRQMRIEAFYDDDTPADAAKVTVAREDGATVAEGRTDDKGVWSFAAPAAGKYRVTVDAGGGHLAKTTVVVPDDPATSEPVTVSEGPNRAALTGPMKWLMAGIGVIVIGVLAVLSRRLLRTREKQP